MRRDFEILVNIIRNAIGEPRSGCELGVWKGMLSQRLLKEFNQLHLLMIDRWVSYDQGPNNQATDATQENMHDFMQMAMEATMLYRNRRILMVGDSIEVSKFVKNHSLDFIFLDANHFYEDVKIDLSSWHSKVRPDGLICGHDYNAKREKEGYWGVKKAVDEFAELNGYKVYTAPYHMWWYE